MGKKNMGAAQSGAEYGKKYMLPFDKEMRAAMNAHQQHHTPESKLDGKTVPYSVMDAKHKGRR